MPVWYLSSIGLLGLCGLVLCIWGLRGDCSNGRRRCPRCWYEVGSIPSLTCPECGHTAAAERRLLRTRRRSRWVLAGLAILCVTSLLPRSWAIYTRGWIAVPRAIRLAAIRWSSVGLNATPNGFDSVLFEDVRAPLPGWEQEILVWSLNARLRDESASARSSAAFLAFMASQAGNSRIRGCVPDLVRLTQDSDFGVQCRTVLALAQIRPGDPALFEVWLDRLERGETSYFRSVAACQLGSMRGQIEHRALISLITALATNQDCGALQGIATGLGETRSPRAIPALALCLVNPAPNVSSRACRAIPQFGQAAAPVVPILAAIATDRHIHAGTDAIMALGDLGPVAKPAVPTLIWIIRQSPIGLNWGGNRHHSMVPEAALALGRIGVASPEVIGLLRECLAANCPLEALESLFRLGWSPPLPDRPTLEKFSRANYPECELWSRLLVARAEGTLSDQVPWLAAKLGRHGYDADAAIIRALMLLGPIARDALPALRNRLSEETIRDRGFRTNEMRDIEDAIRRISGAD